MHILIIGLGNPTPTFILRRLRALIKQNAQLTVVAQLHQQLDLPGATIIRVARKITLAVAVRNIFKACLSPHYFIKLLRTRVDLSFFKRLFWALKYLPVSRAKSPDVIHLQWLGAVPEFSWLRAFFACPIMASARGSMLTVYPITRSGYQGIIEQAIRQVDYIHCVSEDLAQACEKFGAQKNQLIINYNGIDLNRFSPSTVPVENAVFTLISVGAVMWRKAYTFQLQVVKKLQLRGYVIKLMVIGEGPELEALKYTANRLGIGQQVQFVGKVAADELPDWLNRADAYLSTSMAEGLANSVVEAAACGLPVVGFECEGMHEVIEQGIGGFIVPFADVEAVTEKIIFLIEHPKERAIIGRAARSRMEEKFDEHQWTNHMIKTYQQLAG